MVSNTLISHFQKAKKDSSLAIIEGVQALKHAVRFGAEIEKIVTCDIERLTELIHELAPDVSQTVLDAAEVVDSSTFEQLSPRPIRTRTIVLAKRKVYSLSDIKSNRPIVALEDPKDLDNVGAVVRVASAANAAAVITIGNVDVWHPLAIRGGAGLQFATPVFSFTQFDLHSLTRHIVAMDPEGFDIKTCSLPENSIFVFGTERHGITQKMLDDTDTKLRLSMKSGVSSMNLATSVAATLYSLK